jgi:hypothetical protein
MGSGLNPHTDGTVPPPLQRLVLSRREKVETGSRLRGDGKKSEILLREFGYKPKLDPRDETCSVGLCAQVFSLCFLCGLLWCNLTLTGLFVSFRLVLEGSIKRDLLP